MKPYRTDREIFLATSIFCGVLLLIIGVHPIISVCTAPIAGLFGLMFCNGIREPFIEEYNRKRLWHRHFLLLPQRDCITGRPMWLEFVYRRTSCETLDDTCYNDGYGGPIWAWEYKKTPIGCR